MSINRLASYWNRISRPAKHEALSPEAALFKAGAGQSTAELSGNLLEQICQLAVEKNFRMDVTPLEWMSRLIQMHERGWLYCTMKGERLAAVAGAYRIAEWNPHLPDRLPEKLPESSTGNILVVPFVFSTGEVPVACLRLLRFMVRQHSGISTLVYQRSGLHHGFRQRLLKPAAVLAPQEIPVLA